MSSLLGIHSSEWSCLLVLLSFAAFIWLFKYFTLSVSIWSLFILLDAFFFHILDFHFQFSVIILLKNLLEVWETPLNSHTCLLEYSNLFKIYFSYFLFFESSNLYDYKNFGIYMIIRSFLKKQHPDFFLRHISFLCHFRFPYREVGWLAMGHSGGCVIFYAVLLICWSEFWFPPFLSLFECFLWHFPEEQLNSAMGTSETWGWLQRESMRWSPPPYANMTKGSTAY